MNTEHTKQQERGVVQAYAEELKLYRPEDFTIKELINSHRRQREFIRETFSRECRSWSRLALLPRKFVLWLQGY